MSYSTIYEAMYSLTRVERNLLNMPYTLDDEYKEHLLRKQRLSEPMTSKKKKPRKQLRKE